MQLRGRCLDVFVDIDASPANGGGVGVAGVFQQGADFRPHHAVCIASILAPSLIFDRCILASALFNTAPIGELWSFMELQGFTALTGIHLYRTV